MIDNPLRNSLVNLTRDLMLIQSDELHPENRKRCLQIARYRLEALEDIDLMDFEDEGYVSLIAMPRGITTPKVLTTKTHTN